MDGKIVKEDWGDRERSVTTRVFSTTEASDEGTGTTFSGMGGDGSPPNCSGWAKDFSWGSRDDEWEEPDPTKSYRAMLSFGGDVWG